MKIHFIGVGGNGMIGVAKWALDLGFYVSGSDARESENTRHLSELGAKIFIGHDPSYAEDSDFVVYSVGIPSSNVEISAAYAKGIPVFTRMQALGKLSAFLGHQLICVSGTHGKSTTTAILASVLKLYDENLSYYIGAKSISGKEVYAACSGKFAVVEACEYKNEFFHLSPHYCLLTGIEVNHEDFFGDDSTAIIKSFLRFSSFCLNKDGILIACIDSPYIRNGILPFIKGRKSTYGFSQDADFRAYNVKYLKNGMEFSIKIDGKVHQFKTSCIGEHIVQNSLGVIALAYALGVPLEVVKNGLLKYTGSSRRLEVKYRAQGCIVYDDNARIPVQVHSTIKALKGAHPDHKIIIIGGFWGRLNARDLDAFKHVLSAADTALFLPVGMSGKSQGGAEQDDSDQVLSAMLQDIGIRAGIYTDELLKEEIFLNDKKGVVVCTMGYDSYWKDFNRIQRNTHLVSEINQSSL